MFLYLSDLIDDPIRGARVQVPRAFTLRPASAVGSACTFPSGVLPAGVVLVGLTQPIAVALPGTVVALGDDTVLDAAAATWRSKLNAVTPGLISASATTPRKVLQDLLIPHMTRPDEDGFYNLRFHGGAPIRLLTAVQGGAVASDPFTRADAANINTGAPFTWAIDIASYVIASNQIHGTGAGSSAELTIRAEVSASGSDNFTTVDLGASFAAGSVDREVGPVCRMNTTASDRTGYMARVRSDTAQFALGKLDSTGALTTLVTDAAYTAVAGDTIKVQASGSTISAYINGVSKFSITDTAITVGVRGGIAYNDDASGTGDSLDNFVFDVIAVAVVVSPPSLVAHERVLLAPYKPGLQLPILGPPLFAKPYLNANAGAATGTGTAYDATVVATPTKFPYEALLLPALPGLQPPLLNAPFLQPHVRSAYPSTATGTGAAYDATVTSVSGSARFSIAEVLLTPGSRGIQLPILGPPFFQSHVDTAYASAALGTGTAYDATVSAVEYQRPISDISAGSWTVAPLWSKVDEVVIDDADFITSETLVSPGNTSNADLRLNARGDPLSSTGQIISIRAKVTFTLGLNGGIRGELRQGNNVTSTLIGTLTTDALTTSYVTYTYTLSGAEADSITDYGDLFLRLYGNFPVGSLGGVTVSWVQFQQPAGITPDTSVYPTQATGTGTAYDAAASLKPNAGVASGTGAAGAAAASIQTSSGLASGTGAAGNAAGSVSGTAAAATGTGTAGSPAGADAASAGLASGAGSAFDATTTGSVTPPIVVTPLTVGGGKYTAETRLYWESERKRLAAIRDDEEVLCLL